MTMSATVETIIGAIAGVCLVLLALSALFACFVSIVDWAKREGPCRSQTESILFAISMIGVLMCIPTALQAGYGNRTPFNVGARLGVIGVIAGILAPLVVSILVELWRRRGWKKPPPESPPAEAVLTMPVAGRSYWPQMATAFLLLANGVAAIYGSGGTVMGYAAAFVVSPLWWLTWYYFHRVGERRCPHCHRLFGSESRGVSIGSPLWCGFCGNFSRKADA